MFIKLILTSFFVVFDFGQWPRPQDDIISMKAKAQVQSFAGNGIDNIFDWFC